MTKYIKLFEDQVNESAMGRGSIVLIKGKPEKGKRKLFATHIVGFAELKPGAVMLFLADDFYRIREDDGKLKAVKISYRNEDSLKSVLNLKTPGKISVVRNNNKTPLHWKTLKHTSLTSALKEVEQDLIGDDYLFESEVADDVALFNEFSNEVSKALLRALEGARGEITITNYEATEDIVNRIEENIDFNETNRGETEWEADYFFLTIDQKFKKYEVLELPSEIVIGFSFSTEASFNYSYDPGDHWTPPSADSEVDEIETELVAMYVEGEEFEQDAELKEMISKFMARIEDDYDLAKINKTIQKNHLF